MHYTMLTLPTGATLEVFAPIAPANTPAIHKAVVICPGGGYSHLAAREAEPIALRFAGMGFAAFILRYHVGTDLFPLPQQDAACAIATVRRRAAEWQVDPNAITIVGFSAGGHLAASMGVMWHRAELWQPLGLSCEEVRPNAMILSYAVLTAGAYAHRDSFVCLSGSTDEAQHQQFSLETLVDPRTPPTFLWHTWTDQSVPVENALLFAMALHRHNVQAEVHLYPFGAHGGALCVQHTTSNPNKLIPEAQNWPDLAAHFLDSVL